MTNIPGDMLIVIKVTNVVWSLKWFSFILHNNCYFKHVALQYPIEFTRTNVHRKVLTNVEFGFKIEVIFVLVLKNVFFIPNTLCLTSFMVFDAISIIFICSHIQSKSKNILS